MSQINQINLAICGVTCCSQIGLTFRKMQELGLGAHRSPLVAAVERTDVENKGGSQGPYRGYCSGLGG